MKLYAIGIFKITGETETLCCENPVIANHILKEIIATLKDEDLPINCLYRSHVNNVNYFIHKPNAGFIYVIASEKNIATHTLLDYFDDIEKLTPKKDYPKLKNKLLNANEIISSIKKTEREVEKVKKDLLQDIGTILNRNQKIEILVKKTEEMAQSANQLEFNSLKRKTKSRSCAKIAASMFCSFFGCSEPPTPAPHHELELSAPLLRQRFNERRRF